MTEPLGTSGFRLHPRLAADCEYAGDLRLCRVLLMNDQRFVWCILVPRQPALRELHDLTPDDQVGLMREIARVSRALAELPTTTKVNVGALGNLVEQLHVHVVARHPGDAAWPGPVWGPGKAEPYAPPRRRELSDWLATTLDLVR